jgi:hypothetical protein
MNIAIQDDTKSAVREALEAVALELEARGGNAIYVKAWKRAVKIVRSHKPAE